MTRFLDYVYEQNFFDIEDSAYFFMEATAEQIKDHKPKDGKWEGLDGTRSATFYFNVEGDPCGTPSSPCYHVTISGDDLDPSYGVSIAFMRQGTGYGESGQDEPAGVLLGVQKAIYDYIQKRNPAALQWSPVLKHGGPPKKINSKGPTGKPAFEDDTPPCPKDEDGREKCRTKEEKYSQYVEKWQSRRRRIYENLTKQALFPKKYVSTRENFWVRRDLYDKYFVDHGYPKLPESLSDDSSPSEKSKALEDIRKETENNRSQIMRRSGDLRNVLQGEIQRQRDELQRRQREEREQRLRTFIDDRDQNPNNIKREDIVVLGVPVDELGRGGTRTFWQNRRYVIDSLKAQADILGHDLRGKVIEFEVSEGILVANVRLADQRDSHDFDSFTGSSESIPVRELKKEPPENRERISEKRQEILRDLIDGPQNPNELKEGDEVVWNVDDPRDYVFGQVGKVLSFRAENDRTFNYQTRTYTTFRNLVAKIKWERNLFGEAGASRVSQTDLGEAKEYRFGRSPYDKIIKLTPQVEEEMRTRKAEAVGLGAAEAARRRMARQGEREQRMKQRIESGMIRSQQYIDHRLNPQRIKPGDEVTVKNAQEAQAEGIQPYWREISAAGRKGIVLNLVMSYDDELYATVLINRSTMEPTIRVQMLKKGDESAMQARQQRAERRAATRQRLSSGEATGGRNIGDVATVASGPHAGKRGRIIGWRTSGNNTYANIETMVTPQNPTGGRIQVNVRLLQPVASAQSTPEANESFRPNSFDKFLKWRKSYSN